MSDVARARIYRKPLPTSRRSSAATKGSLAEQVRKAVKETMEDAQPQNQDYQVTLSQLRDILQKLQGAKVSPNCNIEGRAETNQHSQHVVSGLGQIDSDVATPMSMIDSQQTVICILN